MNGFVVSNEMAGVIGRDDAFGSVCQIIDRGVSLCAPWSRNYYLWPTNKIDHAKERKEYGLESTLRQFMGHNPREPLRNGYLGNQHVTNAYRHYDEIAFHLIDEISRNTTSISVHITVPET